MALRREWDHRYGKVGTDMDIRISELGKALSQLMSRYSITNRCTGSAILLPMHLGHLAVCSSTYKQPHIHCTNTHTIKHASHLISSHLVSS